MLKAFADAVSDLRLDVDRGAYQADPHSATEEQKKAGNYKKGRVRLHGLDISIENPRHSTRSGVGPDGTPWSVTMSAHYGYILMTEGADDEHVDCYIGPDPHSTKVWIIDQIDADSGKFDEHKAMFGYLTKKAAVKSYKAHFSDGKGGDRLGAAVEMSIDEFKEWLEKGNTKKPLEVKSSQAIKLEHTKQGKSHKVALKLESTSHPIAQGSFIETGTINLHGLSVRPQYRSQGHAERILQHITDYADKKGKPIHLRALAEEEENQEKLKSFYQKHGFTTHKKDRMVRLPVKAHLSQLFQVNDTGYWLNPRDGTEVPVGKDGDFSQPLMRYLSATNQNRKDWVKTALGQGWVMVRFMHFAKGDDLEKIKMRRYTNFLVFTFTAAVNRNLMVKESMVTLCQAYENSPEKPAKVFIELLSPDKDKGFKLTMRRQIAGSKFLLAALKHQFSASSATAAMSSPTSIFPVSTPLGEQFQRPPVPAPHPKLAKMPHRQKLHPRKKFKSLIHLRKQAPERKMVVYTTSPHQQNPVLQHFALFEDGIKVASADVGRYDRSLYNMQVPAYCRGRGYSRQLLGFIMKNHGRPTNLLARAGRKTAYGWDKGSKSTEELVAFYADFGFQPVKTRVDGSVEMMLGDVLR